MRTAAGAIATLALLSFLAVYTRIAKPVDTALGTADPTFQLPPHPTDEGVS